MACDSSSERAEDERGDNDSHEPQKYLRKHMKTDCSDWNVYAKLCAGEDREEGPGCNRTPLDCHEGQENEARNPD